MRKDRNCQSCDYYKDEYCSELDMNPCHPENGCDYFSEQNKIKMDWLGQEPRWIPVKERLPKAGEYIGNVAKYYLVQNEYGDMLVARYTHSEYWEQIYQLKPIADEIIAWCELPQPYKPESEDKG